MDRKIRSETLIWVDCTSPHFFFFFPIFLDLLLIMTVSLSLEVEYGLAPRRPEIATYELARGRN